MRSGVMEYWRDGVMGWWTGGRAAAGARQKGFRGLRFEVSALHSCERSITRASRHGDGRGRWGKHEKLKVESGKWKWGSRKRKAEGNCRKKAQSSQKGAPGVQGPVIELLSVHIVFVFHFFFFWPVALRHRPLLCKGVTNRVTQVTKCEIFHFFFGASDLGSGRGRHIKPSTKVEPADDGGLGA